MATQTGSIDLTASLKAHDDAAKTASKYITDVTNDGIMVHAEGAGPDDTQTPSGWHISDVLEYLRQGVSRFWIGLKNVTDTTPTVRIGKEYVQGATDNESHLELDYHSLQMVDKDGDAYFHVSDLRGTDGTAEITDTFTGDGTKRMFSLTQTATNNRYDVTVTDDTAGGTYDKWADYILFTIAPSIGATITATYSTASERAKAFTYGTRGTGAIGPLSYTEGNQCVASGLCTHAEGHTTTASNGEAHAEGLLTVASGFAAHAEGRKTESSGRYSHAQNYGTIAASEAQTAMGKYNVEDTNDEYALIIGNGTDSANRSNALAVDWDGGIYVDDHDSPIGTVLDTGNVTYSGAMTANTMTQGASLSLTAGTWLLVGLFTFGTASTSGSRNISCDLFQGTVSDTTVCRQRVVSAAANESFLQTIGVVTPTATTSYSIGGSSSVATNQARYSRLTAVRIA